MSSYWPFRDKGDLYTKEKQALRLLLEERKNVIIMSESQPIIIGSIVHYVIPNSNICRAAIVTAKQNNETSNTISVCIINPTGIFFDTHVTEDWLVKTSGSWHRVDQC